MAALEIADPRASEIEHHAQRALGKSPYVELRRVGCRFDDGILTLEGQVTSFYLKQVAQTVVRQIDGVHQVINHLQVQ